MIPKIIHYCWLSDEAIPADLQNCINSWKRLMPDYDIIKWDTKRFDVNSVQLVKQACELKKWAFAADYIRTYALYNYGGIYLDSDVRLYKHLGALMEGSFVSGMEYHPSKEEVLLAKKDLDINGRRLSSNMKVGGIGIQAAIIASVKEHPFVKEVLDFYASVSLDEILRLKYTAPTVYAFHAEKYGFCYVDKKQVLKNDIIIYPSSILSNYDQYTKQSYAVHCCSGSWTQDSLRKSLMNWVKSNRLLYLIYISFKGRN